MFIPIWLLLLLVVILAPNSLPLLLVIGVLVAFPWLGWTILALALGFLCIGLGMALVALPLKVIIPVAWLEAAPPPPPLPPSPKPKRRPEETFSYKLGRAVSWHMGLSYNSRSI